MILTGQDEQCACKLSELPFHFLEACKFSSEAKHQHFCDVSEVPFRYHVGNQFEVDCTGLKSLCPIPAAACPLIALASFNLFTDSIVTITKSFISCDNSNDLYRRDINCIPQHTVDFRTFPLLLNIKRLRAIKCCFVTYPRKMSRVRLGVRVASQSP